jgi:hypothetical protein
MIAKRTEKAAVARASSMRKRRERAAQRAAALAPMIKALHEAGAKTLKALAEGLNAKGIPTASGRGRWIPTQVARVLRRLGRVW